MTLLQLVTALRRRLDDFGGYTGEEWVTDDSTCLWSNVELTEYLTEAENEFCKRVPIRCDTSDSNDFAALVTVAAQAEYALDPRILYVNAVTLDGIPLDKATSKELDWAADGYTDWRGESDSIVTHYADSFSGSTDGYLRLIPTPTVADQVINLEVDRLPIGPLNWDYNDTSSPEIPSVHHVRLLDWATALAFQKQDMETSDPERSILYENRFDARVGRPLSVRQQDIVRRIRNLRPRTRAQY